MKAVNTLRNINWSYLRDRAHQYYLLTRMDRPIGIFLLLWPTLWALWVAAEGFPDWQIPENLSEYFRVPYRP